jgi:hypothetical protein
VSSIFLYLCCHGCEPGHPRSFLQTHALIWNCQHILLLPLSSCSHFFVLIGLFRQKTCLKYVAIHIRLSLYNACIVTLSCKSNSSNIATHSALNCYRFSGWLITDISLSLSLVCQSYFWFNWILYFFSMCHL